MSDIVQPSRAVPAVSEGRNAGLDGLRGLAALSVALGHSFLQITGLALWATTLHNFHTMPSADVRLRLLSTLFPSDAAVMVFFVLSGHVLWGSFQRKQLRFFAALPDYACARVYRLFPLAIASALPLGLMIGSPAPDLVKNMLLLSNNINGVLWSLQVEVVASFALFALWGLTRGRSWKIILALILGLVATQLFRGNFTVVFFPAFILGASISLVPSWFWRNPWIIAGGIAILLFTNVVLGHNGLDRFFEIAGATVLVGAVANGRLRFLRARPVLFMGAISYPFYLTDVVGLLCAERYMNPHWSTSPLVMFAIRAGASIAVTIPLAWLLHVFVEDPVLRARPRFAGWPRILRSGAVLSDRRRRSNLKSPGL